MKKKWQGADQLGSETPRQGRLERKTSRGEVRSAGQIALAMLDEIRKRRGTR